jgi:predicted  nucleic acid-binding Zn-ribbon protein
MTLTDEDIQTLKEQISKGLGKTVVDFLKPIYAYIEKLNGRVERLEKGVDQVEVGLLVDKITVLEARLRDMEYELVKLRERDEEVPSPWK